MQNKYARNSMYDKRKLSENVSLEMMKDIQTGEPLNDSILKKKKSSQHSVLGIKMSGFFFNWAHFSL